jgi:hypothetical protein
MSFALAAVGESAAIASAAAAKTPEESPKQPFLDTVITRTPF